MTSISLPLSSFLENHPDVAYIHHHWIDMSGILRGRMLTKRYSIEMAESNKPLRLSPFCMMSTVALFKLPREYIPGGWTNLRPDWSSLRMLRPGHASVMGSVMEDTMDHLGNDFCLPLRGCPRMALGKVVDTAASEHGLDILLGFELEFYLIDEIDKTSSIALSHFYPSLDEYGWSAAAPINSRSTKCLEACVRALEQAGVEVQQLHCEAGPHQFEISTAPLPTLQAIDAVVQSQQIVRLVANDFGFRATFQPRPFINLPTSGLQAHLSIKKNTAKTDAERRATEDAFLAGVLRRLPLLCFFGMATPNSYTRVDTSAVGKLVGWGTGNRDMPVRKIGEGHWEMRAIDAIANPYLTIAAYITAGLLGIQEEEINRWKDCRDFINRLEDEQAKCLGLVTTMPKSLGEARAKFEESKMGLEKLIANELLELHWHVKKMEEEVFSNMTEEEQDVMYRRYV